MTLPDYAVEFRGLPACPCLAEWLPVYEHEMQRRGVLIGTLPIFQLIGDADASGGTHSKGGAFDVTDLRSPGDVVIARQMGADATWARTSAQGFVPHLHGVLRGCPHNGPARYQIDAVDAGFNGLGRLGMGGPDDGPRPLSGRTWQQGIQWAHAQEEDPMPLWSEWPEEEQQSFLSAVGAAAAKAVLASAVDNAGTKVRAALEAAGRFARKQLGD